MAKMDLSKLSNPKFITMMELLLKTKLPAKTAYKVMTLTYKFNEELKKFQEVRTHLLESYALKREDGSFILEGDSYTFDPDSKLGMLKGLSELLSVEIEFEPIKIDDLGDISLTAEDLMYLGDIIR